MFNRTMIALAATLTLGATSAALANDIDQNPSTAQSTREWQAGGKFRRDVRRWRHGFSQYTARANAGG